MLIQIRKDLWVNTTTIAAVQWLAYSEGVKAYEVHTTQRITYLEIDNPESSFIVEKEYEGAFQAWLQAQESGAK